MNPPNYEQKTTNLTHESSYNLWEDSQYFEFSNFNIQSLRAGGSSWPSVDLYISPSLYIERDERNRRIVTRDQLFQDPECFQYTHMHNAEELKKSEPYESYSSSSWTATNFLKSKENARKFHPQHEESCNETRVVKRNIIEEKFEQAMAQPVNMSKAEKIMQKMGWSGGALGKDGYGITTPIVPNAAYATSTIGLGHKTETIQKTSEPNKKTCDPKENFTTNVLLTILDFIKNNSELEIVFGRQLVKHERKEIHVIVDSIGDISLFNMDTVQQGDLFADIVDCNEFVLGTYSEGKYPNRTLCLYKEAPPNMYLITPEDLKPDDDDTNKDADEAIDEIDTASNSTASHKTTHNKTTKHRRDKHKTDTHKTKTKENEIEDDISDLEIDESNPFLLSITRSLRSKKKVDTTKKEDNVVSQDIIKEFTTDTDKVVDSKNVFDVRDAIIEYFKEFCADDNYEQLRFTGPFTDNDFSIINTFFKDISLGIEDPIGFKEKFVNSGLVECMADLILVIKEDRNGHSAIYKLMLDKR